MVFTLTGKNLQEAHGRGLPWGAGLGLWGDTEAGLLNDAARARTLTARGLDSSIGSNQRGQSAGCAACACAPWKLPDGIFISLDIQSPSSYSGICNAFM